MKVSLLIVSHKLLYGLQKLGIGDNDISAIRLLPWAIITIIVHFTTLLKYD